MTEPGASAAQDTGDSSIIDLPDFIAENYTIKFKINGNAYQFNYGEATVDELLRIAWQKTRTEGIDMIEMERRILSAFLKKVITHGDPEQLDKDLLTMPYNRPAAPNDINRLMRLIETRVKKNESGQEPVKSPEVASV